MFVLKATYNWAAPHGRNPQNLDAVLNCPDSSKQISACASECHGAGKLSPRDTSHPAAPPILIVQWQCTECD